jgi:predicted DNA-binding transcriptional regulator AlpA
MKAESRNESNSFPSQTEKFLTVKELARRYRSPEIVIYRWILEKRFPENVVLRLGSKILINRENLEVFESQGGNLLKGSEQDSV